jgi:hypothetical protein
MLFGSRFASPGPAAAISKSRPITKKVEFHNGGKGVTIRSGPGSERPDSDSDLKTDSMMRSS